MNESEVLVYVYNGIQQSSNKEQNYAIFSNMDGIIESHAELCKSKEKRIAQE